MLVISLIGKTLGPALLGEYLLVRRMASWFQAAVSLPSGVALPRYVASSVDEPISTRQTYFLAAMLTGCGFGLVLCAVLVVGRNVLSRPLFGSEQLAHLTLPLGVLLIGLGAHGAVFGYYQGTLAMGRASFLQVVNLVAVPLLATILLARTHSIALIVNGMGISMIVGACCFTFPIIQNLRLHDVAQQFIKRTRELIFYGFARVSGDFGLQALLSLPAIIALHYLPIGSVSFLLLGGSFLAVVAASTLPLGTILLSRVSRSIAEKRTADLQVHLSHFVSAIVELSLFICLQMIVFSDSIIRMWVGSRFLDGIVVVQIAILAVPFYFVYAGLRSVIDGAAIKAYNTWNIAISVAGFLIVVAVVKMIVPQNHLLEGLAAASVIGLAALAYLTLRTLRQLFQIKLHWLGNLPGLGLAVAFAVASYGMHRWLPFQIGLTALATIELLVLGAYVFLLRAIRSPWLLFFLKMLLPNFSLGENSTA